MRDCLTIFIGGQAGQGLATIGNFLARILTKSGYDFITYQGYHSRIRGGHNTYALKVFSEKISGPDERADLVVSLNQETDALDGPRLTPGGLLLAASSGAKVPDGAKSLTVPYADLAATTEQNMVALGLLISALGLPLEEATKEVSAKFKDKSQKFILALEKAYNWAEPQIGGQYKPESARKTTGPRLLIDGNTALALGAAAGGINFCSFYPMTPGSSVALSLAAWAAEAGLIVEQAEDEIAAINMALGAAYAGSPALVSTSGGGFALMGEGISLAGMLELPVVMAVVQRPGPATGLPTRTEQADLDLVLYSGHGEFPRAILAPGTTEECFDLAARAVWLAEESQGPVFILSDQFQADRETPVQPFDLNFLTKTKKMASPVNPAEIHRRNQAAISAGAEYLRYDPTPQDGRSPRLLPGFSDHLVRVDSDEHTPAGYLTEDLDIRVQQQDKRMKKMGWLKEQVLPPDYHGSENPQAILVSWGSTLGASLEAVEALTKSGHKVGLLHFKQVYPLNPEDWLPRLESADRVVFIESNHQGQFARLVQRETSFKSSTLVLRYDGLPLTAEYILNRLEVLP